jgi:hypothetical protein
LCGRSLRRVAVDARGRHAGDLSRAQPRSLNRVERGPAAAGRGFAGDAAVQSSVGPRADCRFWYVNEYYDTTSARGWNTRIAAFRMPGCS